MLGDKCLVCGKGITKLASIDFYGGKKYEGTTIEIRVPKLQIQKCDKCGEKVFDISVDAQITKALRDKIGLLSPETINKECIRLGYTIDGLAVKIGSTPAMIDLWLNDLALQKRELDNKMRELFGLTPST